MKKTFTLLRVLAICLFALFSVHFANATVCGSATNIPSVPVTSQALVCGAANDLSSTTVPTACGGASNNYKGGQEALYTFTPSTTGTYTVSVAGQTWTGIFVYAGCPSSGGTCIGSVGSSNSSKSINVSLTSGTTYYIWFDTYPTPNSPCPGTFSLVLAPPPPANDNCSGAIAFPSIPTNGTCASVTTNTASATQSLAACVGSGADDDVWYSFVQPTGFTTLNFAHTDISGNTDRVTQFFSACGGTSLLCSDPESGTVTGLVGGNTYYVRVHTYGTGTSTSSTLCLSVPPPPPANNDCAGATAFPAIPTNGTCANLTLNTASASQSLAACVGSGADDDVWFSFVQPAGNTTINFTNTTVSGNTDRVIQFFSACGGTSLLCSDPETGTVTGLTPGVTYYGRIHTYGTGTSTNVTVCLSVPPPPPANDDCANAITLGAACAGSPVSGSTLLSTVDAIYSNCGAGGSNTTERGVWYKYVGDNNNVTINTCSTPGYDTRITVYSGTCGALSCVTGNDDMGAGCTAISTLRSQVSFDAFAGTDYYVFVHGYQLNPSLSATGNFVLNISCTALCTPVVTNSTCATAIGQSVPTSCSSFAVNNTCAGTALSEPPGAPLFGTYPNLWYSFVAPATDVNIRATLSGTATNVGFVVYPSCGGTNVGFVYPATSGTNYVFSGLTIGNTYYVQVYTPIANKGTFDLCLFYELCPTPLTLTATGITSSQANLGWASSGTLFDVELGSSGFTPTGTPTTAGVTNPFTQTGLSPATTYTYYVRRDCGAGVYSTWNGPFSFTTLPTPPANDNCATAVSINPDVTCTGAASVNGTIQGATNSGVAATTGTADDDVWYSFVAENTTQIVTLTNPNFTDFVTQILSGSCGSFTSLGYYDADPNNLSVTGLTVGNTYYIRVYSYSNGTLFSNPNAQFSLCVQNPPPPPANDECAGAIAFPTILTTGACASVTVNTAGATQSLAGCSGTADDDVWYTFVVPAGKTSVDYSTSNISGSSDRIFQLFDACAGTSLYCNDIENGTFSGLISGNTYVLRTYTYSSGAVSNFSLCLNITPPPPANDNCASAKPLVSCGAPDSISLLSGATQSLAAGSCGGTAGDDVWYSFVADATTMYITTKGFGGYDPVVEVRSGSCNGTELDCVDLSGSDAFEDISVSFLTVGQTYYVRVYDYYNAPPTALMGFWIQVGPAGCWQGGNSSDWSDAGNWNNFSVPNSCASNVVIPAGTPNAPAITTANYTVGNVNIASGVNLTLTGNNLNVCGNWAAGTGSNAVTVGTGRVILQGTGSQTITGNTRFESLTVNSVGGSYTNTGIVEIASRLRPQSGTLTNSGTLHFLSTSATDIATINLAVGNTGTISGNIIADRYVPVSGSNQHYVSSPVNSLPLAQFGASGGSGFVVPTPTCDETVLASGSPYGTVFRYNEANGASCSLAGWEVMGGGNADNSRGYSAYLTGAGAPLSVTGAPNMAASYSLTGLTNTGWTNTTLQGRTQNGGWSLVGNPYLSTVNLAAKAGLDAQAQVWQTSGPYAGTYQAVIMGGGTAFVAPFQGFMVHKTTVGGTATFDIGRAECVNNTSTFYKTGNDNGTLSLKVSGNGFNDITTIAFDPQATNQFDVDKDANKLPGRLVQPMIASKVGNDKFSINTLESISTNPSVDIEFMAGTNGNFTITADDLSTFDPTVMVYLEDKIAHGAWKDLRQSNTYSFSGNVTDSKDRFVLHFTPAAYVSTEDAVCEKGGVIAMEQEGDVKWTVEVKNATTKVIAAKAQPLSSTNGVTLNNIPVGTYDILFTGSNGYVATKTVTIGGTNPLVAHYTSSTSTPTVNQSVAFTSSVNQAATTSWNFGDGSTSTVANPSHVYAAPGTYTVVLKATNNEGCEATFSQTVTVADVTGIGNVNASGKDVSVYVNSEKNLNITFTGYKSELATIQVFNIIGQEILNVKHNTGTKFVHEIDQVEAAYLIVKVTIAGQTTTKKVLITKE